jgi:hypothetical protein
MRVLEESRIFQAISECVIEADMRKPDEHGAFT